MLLTNVTPINLIKNLKNYNNNIILFKEMENSISVMQFVLFT